MGNPLAPREIRKARTHAECVKPVIVKQGEIDDILERLQQLEENMEVVKTTAPSYAFPW